MTQKVFSFNVVQPHERPESTNMFTRKLFQQIPYLNTTRLQRLRMPYTVTDTQRAFFARNGYLIITDVLNSSAVKNLQAWVQEVHDWDRIPEASYLQYDEIIAGETVLCRTENFTSKHLQLSSLLRGEVCDGRLKSLTGKDMVLFKEKSEFFHLNKAQKLMLLSQL